MRRQVGPAMRQAGKAALLLMPYDNPPAFKQAWCIVDLATAAQTSRLTNDAVYSQGSAKFFMMLPKSEQPWFRETFNDRFDKLLAAVNSIDLRTANTPDPDDKSIILDLCGDVDLLHSSVLFMLRTWLMEQGNAYILQMEAQKGPDHPKVALMLNNMSMLLNDMGREEEASKYANRALDIIEKIGP
ncbi:hypothetical protein CYMTET_31056 [Cymbomonas tetramitiformis]|uniref:Tetratricopeptide repeat protein n=1 Tax=Cymbomonas tetramitiformis TaxID=36881 RepID=A0AAE0KTI8_9CHLO|nr:hypothetical protein CYMTET_31056 [Cymbomonas tetramitiformis]